MLRTAFERAAAVWSTASSFSCTGGSEARARQKAGTPVSDRRCGSGQIRRRRRSSLLAARAPQPFGPSCDRKRFIQPRRWSRDPYRTAAADTTDSRAWQGLTHARVQTSGPPRARRKCRAAFIITSEIPSSQRLAALLPESRGNKEYWKLSIARPTISGSPLAVPLRQRHACSGAHNRTS